MHEAIHILVPDEDAPALRKSVNLFSVKLLDVLVQVEKKIRRDFRATIAWLDNFQVFFVKFPDDVVHKKFFPVLKFNLMNGCREVRSKVC